MLKLGITGGIGSGKTTVCRVFELLGVPVYYSDEEARKIVSENSQVYQLIVSAFGNSILDDENKIDRKKLAALVFNDPEKLSRLNRIVHPAVAQHFEAWVKKQNNVNYVLKEAAILFESGAYKQVDKILTVIAPLALKIKRIQERDHSTAAEIEKRIASQMSDEEKVKRSDFIIHNDETMLVVPQILAIHKVLKES